MNRKNRKKVVPSDFVTYGEAGGKPEKKQKTTTPPPDAASQMRRWSEENQK